MARRIKRFFVFLFFSLFFSLLSGKGENQRGDSNPVSKGWNTAEAKCCPEKKSVAVCKNVCCSQPCKTKDDGSVYCPD